MNRQAVGEIFIEEAYRVQAEQTARSLFARLPDGIAYAQSLVECLATGYLIAVVESICIREMQRHVDPLTEVVVGRSMRFDHLGPIPPATCLRVRGWVERLGERSATFCVQAHDAHEAVFDGTITVVATQRTVIEPRIAAKVTALQAARAAA